MVSGHVKGAPSPGNHLHKQHSSQRSPAHQGSPFKEQVTGTSQEQGLISNSIWKLFQKNCLNTLRELKKHVCGHQAASLPHNTPKLCKGAAKPTARWDFCSTTSRNPGASKYLAPASDPSHNSAAFSFPQAARSQPKLQTPQKTLCPTRGRCSKQVRGTQLPSRRPTGNSAAPKAARGCAPRRTCSTTGNSLPPARAVSR